MENKWRASRYGIDGQLIDFGSETEVPERDLILEYLEFVDDVLDELDSRDEVEHIRWILDHGTGADRQLGPTKPGPRRQGRRPVHDRRDESWPLTA